MAFFAAGLPHLRPPIPRGSGGSAPGAPQRSPRTTLSKTRKNALELTHRMRLVVCALCVMHDTAGWRSRAKLRGLQLALLRTAAPAARPPRQPPASPLQPHPIARCTLLLLFIYMLVGCLCIGAPWRRQPTIRGGWRLQQSASIAAALLAPLRCTGLALGAPLLPTYYLMCFIATVSVTLERMLSSL